MSGYAFWEELLPALRRQCIGGDFTIRTLNQTIRGPLRDIQIIRHDLVLTGEWCARRTAVSNGWVRDDTTTYSFPLQHCRQSVTVQGRISFNVWGTAITLFSKNSGNKLDLIEVRERR